MLFFHNIHVSLIFITGDITRHGDYSNGRHHCHFKAWQGSSCSGINWILLILNTSILVVVIQAPVLINTIYCEAWILEVL